MQDMCLSAVDCLPERRTHASVKIVSAYIIFAYALFSVGEHEHTRIHTHAYRAGDFFHPRVHGLGARFRGRRKQPTSTRSSSPVSAAVSISSMNLKRESQGVVDGIVAEDIGKFPDTNLAESLQRITGVSIDRSIGEGSRVTVRGVGPDYNLVLLNGRQMPGVEHRGYRRFELALIRLRESRLRGGQRGRGVQDEPRRDIDWRHRRHDQHQDLASARRSGIAIATLASRASWISRRTTCRRISRVIRSRPRSRASSARRPKTARSVSR